MYRQQQPPQLQMMMDRPRKRPRLAAALSLTLDNDKATPAAAGSPIGGIRPSGDASPERLTTLSTQSPFGHFPVYNLHSSSRSEGCLDRVPPPVPSGVNLALLHLTDSVKPSPLLTEATQLLFDTFPGLYPKENFPSSEQGPVRMPPKEVTRISRTGVRRCQPAIRTHVRCTPMHSCMVALYRERGPTSPTSPRSHSSGGVRTPARVADDDADGEPDLDEDDGPDFHHRNHSDPDHHHQLRYSEDSSPEVFCVAYFDLVETVTRKFALPADAGLDDQQLRALAQREQQQQPQLSKYGGSESPDAERPADDSGPAVAACTEEEKQLQLKALAAAEPFETSRAQHLRLLLIGTKPEYRGCGAGRLVVNYIRDLRSRCGVEMVICCSPAAFPFWHQPMMGRFTRAPPLDDITDALNVFTDTRLLRQAPKTQQYLHRQTQHHWHTARLGAATVDSSFEDSGSASAADGHQMDAADAESVQPPQQALRRSSRRRAGGCRGYNLRSRGGQAAVSDDSTPSRDASPSRAATHQPAPGATAAAAAKRLLGVRRRHSEQHTEDPRQLADRLHQLHKAAPPRLSHVDLDAPAWAVPLDMANPSADQAHSSLALCCVHWPRLLQAGGSADCRRD